MLKIKCKVKIFLFTLATLIVFSSINVFAETTTWTLKKENTSATSINLGLYHHCRVVDFRNDFSSNDGVNLYIDYSYPGESWHNALHLFAEPGTNAASNVVMNANQGQGVNWRGVMNSWWWNGKNNAATATIEAY